MSNELNHISFILMLYEYKGERKSFNCDFPNQFLKQFENENPQDYFIGFFFVIGQEQSSIKTLQDAIKFCKA